MNRAPSTPVPSRAVPSAVGFGALLALGLNGIVGVGIFFVPAEVARHAPGTASPWAFAWTCLAMVPVAVAVGTLGSRFDEDGGPVLYARAAFGSPAAFVVGWLAYVTSVFSCAAIHVGLTRALLDSAGVRAAFAQPVGAILLLLALSAVSAFGIRVSARVWSVLTVLKLAPLVLLVLAAWALAPPAPPPLPSLHEGPTEPPVAWLRAALTITFAYQGFEIVPVLAGQAGRSRRLIPAAVLGALMVAGALYTMLQIACVRALPQLAQSAFPLAAAGEVYGGPALGSLLRVGTTVSAVGIAFGMITMTPHFLAALARVSDLGWGLDRSSGTGTPTRALAVTMALVSALVCLGDLGELFTLSSIAVVTQYGVAALALVVLAFRKERGLGLRHAWSALPTLAIVVALLSGATAREWAVAAATCAIGFGVKLARTCFARAPRAS